jgi:hypothetical protein
MFRFFQNAKLSLDSLLNVITDLVADGLLFFRLLFRSRTSLSAEVLFLAGIPEPAAVFQPLQGNGIPWLKTARSWLAQFSAASITNTGGKGSPREGWEELKGHCAVNASSQFLVGCPDGTAGAFRLQRTS